MRIFFKLALLALLVTGCAEPEQEMAEPVSQTDGAIGYLLLSQTASGEASQDITVDVHGTFASFRNTSRTAVDELLDAPLALSPGECQLRETLETHGAGALDAEIELLDAGLLYVQGARVYPRTFPEVGSMIEGAFYASRIALEADEVGERYEAYSEGSQDIPAFEATLAADAAGPVLYHDAALTDPLQGLAHNRQQDLEVYWEGSAMPASDGSLVYIELYTREARVRCASDDNGYFRLSAELLTDLSTAHLAELVAYREMRSELAVATIPGAQFIVRHEGPVVPITLR